MESFDVYLNGKHIDTVFYSTGHHAGDKKEDAEEDVKRSLVGHDGYSPDIVVKMNMRKSSKGKR